MKTFLLAIGMIFCGAFWVGCDSEEGAAAPGGTTDALPMLGADQSSDESIDIEQAADQMLQDAGDEVKQVADKVSDEAVTQAKALTDEAESVASSLIADTNAELTLDAPSQSFQQFLSSAAKKLGEHESEMATLKSLGKTLANTDLDKLIAAASDKLQVAQDLYKQLKTVTGARDLKAMMTQLTDVFSQLGQLSQQVLDKVESIKKATSGTETSWK